jgi:hypothetical protein
MFEAPSEAELALGAAPSASVSLLMPTLSGDVAGPPQLNTVQKIRNLIVDPTPPQLNDVLTGISVGGQVRWGPGPYTVQAAGHIPILAAPPSLTFGNLSAATQLTPPINGRVLLTFDGFSPAAQYVVKALPDLQGVNQTNPPTIPVVEYVGTNVAPPGLLLTVFDSRQGTPVPDTVLSSMHLMVEISQFARRVQP